MSAKRQEALISEARKIISNNNEKRKNSGGDFNIFSILGIERDEVFAHSNMIYSFLNPDSGHFMGKEYLKLFVKHVMEINDPIELSKEWFAEREWPFSNGRIDFVVFSDSRYAAIEMKIDASDQEAQLSRYEQYAKMQNRQNYDVFYLTIDGKDASEQSTAGLQKDYHRISFRKHIVDWLNLCIGITPISNKAYNALIQYRELIEKLISDQKGVEEMSEILYSTANYRAYLELQKSEQVMKEEFLKKFFRSFEERLKRDVNPGFQMVTKGGDTIDIKEVDQFLNKTNSRIEFRLETGKIISLKNGKQYNLIFSIDIGETSGDIAIGYGLSDIQDVKPVKLEDVITDYKADIEAIEKTLDIDKCNSKENLKGWWIYWVFIYSENQIKYNLRSFNDPVIEMLDDKNFEIEMDRIIGTVNSHLGRIK